jgi:hypothetical protein
MQSYVKWISSVCIVVVLATLVTSATAQITIEGEVVDAASGEVLPGASIQLEDTYSGTITNASGRFSLVLQELPSFLIVRFIGYQSTRIEVHAGHVGPLHITLAASTIRLPEITISGQDPAIRIMRRVIEEKQVWRKTLSTYAVTAYNRFRMENESGIVSIWESGTQAYWDTNRGVREVSLWQNQTQNMNMSDLLPAAMFVMNLYDDDIEVAGHNLMGVTHPKALSFYDFKLDKITARDEAEVYVISVAPKQKTSAGFVGTIAVLDGAFALLSAELRPGSAFLFPPPVQYVNVEYTQQFSNFGTDVWLPVDFKADMDVKIGINGVLVFPEFKIRQLSSLTDFKINVPVPDSLYEQKNSVVKDTTVGKVEVLPAERISIPLTDEELKAYSTIDSTMTLEKAYKPKGILARYVISNSNSSGTSVTVTGGVSSTGGNLPFSIRPGAWVNRVEGFHGHVRTTVEPVKKVVLLGLIGYSTAQKFTSYGFGLESKTKVSLRLWYSDEIVTQFKSDVRNPLFNTLNVLAGEADYFEYYSAKGWTMSARAKWPRNRRITGTLTYGAETHAPLSQKSFNSFLGQKLDVRANSPISAGQLQYAKFEVEGDIESLPFPIGPQKHWKATIEQSLGGNLVASGNYTRYEGIITWRVPTFFKRRLLSNALEIRVVGGAIRGKNIPIQKLGIVDGSSFHTSFGSIKTLDSVPYRGSTWGLVAWEHTFRTVPFELIGWKWAVDRHWNLIAHGAHGKTSIKRAVTGVFSSPGIHSELGVSLSGLFTLFRVDTAWRLDQKDFRIGLAMARIF